MTKPFTEQIFRTTYKDDFRDSDNYHRILFNSGRALQARELTQLQTIIQKEIERFGSNIFKDGAPINPGGVKTYNEFEFIKISANTPLPSNKDLLENAIFTGQTSDIRFKILRAIPAENDDPETIYVQYLDGGQEDIEVPERITPGESITGLVDGNSQTFEVQTTNTSSNPAFGRGCAFEVGEGSFYVQGHFVFNEQQLIILSKYSQSYNGEVGFRVLQDIVTSDDEAALFDNQGVTPNRSSPGADRYRIRLQLARKEDVLAAENYVTISDIFNGRIVERPTADKGLKSVRDFVATRNKEISGDFIKKYFKAQFIPNDDNTFKLRVDPGLAYINGYRVEKKKPTNLIVDKPTKTFTQDNDQTLVDYGNYFVVSGLAGFGGKGMPDFGSCQELELRTSQDYGGEFIGTTNVRAITEWQNGLYKLHVFNTKITRNGFSTRDIQSIGSSPTSYYNIFNVNNQTLFETRKKKLLFDTPIQRPESLSSISLTGQRVFSGQQANGSGTISITLSGGANEAFTNTNDWVIADDSDAFVSGYSIQIVGSQSETATITGLTPSEFYDIAAYVRKGSASVRTKTLTEATVTSAVESDGQGVLTIPLEKSDIFEVSRIRRNDSDGDDLFNSFIVDTGARDTHYDDGLLIYKGGSLDSSDNVFVRFKHFDHGSGDFFAVNSYNGQVAYRDIPAHRMDNGRLVSLRDVLDFRPSTDGSGTFDTVNELPQPTGLVEADASYYLPRKDKLILSQTGELRYLQGTPSLQPEFPTTPVDCIDLYKYELNANTLHTKDLKGRLLPMKGYTMSDISKLESKLDKVEEMATLSLLELSTKNLQVLDSSGIDRTKAGFFVDNFANHTYSDTSNIEYRAAIDPQKKFLRPSHKDHNIDLYYDSNDADNLQVTKKGDLVMLDFEEVDWLSQPAASRTENLNPFHVERIIGQVELSPSTDHWRETEITEPLVIDQGTVLDTNQALLWNSHEWNWSGRDLNELQVGATVGQSTSSNTSTTANTSEPRVVGEEVRVNQGDWVATGTVSESEIIDTQEEIVSQETDEIVSTEFIGLDLEENDLWFSGDPSRNIRIDNRPGQVTTIDTVTETTVETRETVETVDTTTLEQTTTTEVETEWQTDTTFATTTDTTTTVNRVASEHTIREIVGSRVVDVLTIPWMRSRVVSFRATGLRPNTRYFPFFDQTLVETFVKNTTDTSGFVRFSDRNPEFRRTSLTPATAHSDPNANNILVSDANGTVTGEFEIPNNSAMRFSTGTKEFALLDISKYNLDNALSFCTNFYTSVGFLDVVQETVHSTRVLEVVGERSTTSNTDFRTESTLSTEVTSDTTVATDVDVETSVSENVSQETTTDTTTRSEFIPPSAVYTDPLAQTFAVNGGEEKNGVFLTKIRVYFSTKDAGDVPCRVEIRPTVNGVPSSDVVVPGSKVTKTPAQITAIDEVIGPNPTISDMLANGTDFEFEEPIYLRGATEYAVVLISSSMEYKVFISQVTDFELGTTERRIAKQPYLGSLFKSQNSRLWEPSQEEDLAFQMYRAEFENEGNVFLTNVEAPPAILTKNPMYMDSGSNSVTVFNRNHGLRPGDVTLIEGLDSGTTYNGILGSSLLGQRTVAEADGAGYRFNADSDATLAGRFGGGKVRGSQNMTFESVFPTIQTLKPENTTLTFSGKFTTQSSLVNPTAGRYSQDTSFELIKNYGNFFFESPRMIANPIEEANELAVFDRPKSAIVQVSLTTSDTKVSPVIDMQRAGLGLIGNLIDQQKSDTDETFIFEADSDQAVFSGTDDFGNTLSYGTGDNDYISVYVADSDDPTLGRLINRGAFTATDGNSLTFDNPTEIDSGDVVTIQSYEIGSSNDNIPLSYVRETHPFLGSSLAKHVTIPVTLENDGFGLKIILAANKPPQADFDVYYKTAGADDSLTSVAWTKANPDNTLPSDTNQSTFREYRYSIGGSDDINNLVGAELPEFRKFQVKLVLKSTNSAKVPLIRDLRCIALT